MWVWVICILLHLTQFCIWHQVRYHPYGRWPHVWADVREEIDVDDEGDNGEVCALCCMKKASLLLVQCLWDGGMLVPNSLLSLQGILGRGKSQTIPGVPAVKVARSACAARILSLGVLTPGLGVGVGWWCRGDSGWTGGAVS